MARASVVKSTGSGVTLPGLKSLVALYYIPLAVTNPL